jgi:hypothetical protein
MPDRTLGLDPADFGTTGLTLGLLVGIAFNEPERALPRESRWGRGGGQEPMSSWRIRAVQEVLRRNGVDLDAPIAADPGADDELHPLQGQAVHRAVLLVARQGAVPRLLPAHALRGGVRQDLLGVRRRGARPHHPRPRAGRGGRRRTGGGLMGIRQDRAAALLALYDTGDYDAIRFIRRDDEVHVVSVESGRAARRRRAVLGEDAADLVSFALGDTWTVCGTRLQRHTGGFEQGAQLVSHFPDEMLCFECHKAFGVDRGAVIFELNVDDGQPDTALGRLDSDLITKGRGLA